LGKKDVTLIKNEVNISIEIVVFEGFFDYLTFNNLRRNENSNCDFLILNSTALLFKAEELLRDYDKISLFLDNDNNGKSAKEKIQYQYEKVEDCSLLYFDFKDLNEWFCNSNTVF
jgi:5S rRNA maturation endonuclease (ribonuclease M5)